MGELNGSADAAANAHGEQQDNKEEEVITALSTAALESKLRALRDQSDKHSQALTQRLATSQSGQSLLHIGSSLSSLPPDLHSLLTQLHPILSAAEASEKQNLQYLQKLVSFGNEIRLEQRRVEHAIECAEFLDDLIAAERDVKSSKGRSILPRENVESSEMLDELDHIASLERAAHAALCLVQELEASSERVSILTSRLSMQDNSTLPSLRSPLEYDTERAQFIMKLAPRIRRLEADTSVSLSQKLESLLKRLQKRREESHIAEDNAELNQVGQEEDILMIGHCMRGLALLGKGKESEIVFARVAIMPLIRSKVSIGRLDEGGPRGECAGLFSLLDDMACSIASQFGPVLRMSESTFDVGGSAMEVDLVTGGVWVPIATALMADTGIKMAIFSPGIANILQANYRALDTFLSELAGRLLQDNGGQQDATLSDELRPFLSTTKSLIAKAQRRIYDHPKTAEFSKRWNLPIYYQLRFGDSCNRLNSAIEKTQREGWHAIYVESPSHVEKARKESGFEKFLFVELYDVISDFWSPDVFLRPLSHRFLRGAVQLICRTVAFVREGLEGKLKFGEEKKNSQGFSTENGSDMNGDVLDGTVDITRTSVRDPYLWNENLEDVASVAWELTVLESKMTHEYLEKAIKTIIVDETSEAEEKKIRSLVKEVLTEAAEQVAPVVQQSWNGVVVDILTKRCCGPLGAVKGVAATYRMTNRPPPSQASPFVATILRALKEFDSEFKHRTPPQIGRRWKLSVVNTVSQRYSMAVEELIATVQRTEEALKNRKARRANIGGMSDGEKVKLQLYLDYQAFFKDVKELGIDPSTVEGVQKLQALTQEAENLRSSTNGRAK